MSATRESPPLGLYLHFPWCAQKCPYCDFASRVRTDPPCSAYVDALLGELRGWRGLLAGDDRPLASIFLGGGTPSLFPGPELARLLAGIKGLWSLRAGCEITVEANPDSLSPAWLESLGEAGMNRPSVGIQSVSDPRLRFLGRPHDRARALEAMARVAADFANFNLDLIYATPGQGWEAWRRELEEVLGFSPPHLSCYTLSIEPGTPFFRAREKGHWPPPDPAEEAELFAATREFLGQAGWEGYEISNFARPGHRCRHNLLYWSYHDWLGVGAGAHGKLVRDRRIWRTAHGPDPEQYRREVAAGRLPRWPAAPLSPEEAVTEFLLLGLRLAEGFPREALLALAPGAGLWERLQQLLGWGMLAEESGRIRLTRRGLPLLDEVVARLV